MTKDIVELKIPKKPDYISLVRLTSSGIASGLGFNIEEIDDIKVCIGEACINALSFEKEDNIKIRFEVEDKNLSIMIDSVREEFTEELESDRPLKLGLLIIKSLMDEVKFTDRGIEMIKKNLKDDING